MVHDLCGKLCRPPDWPLLGWLRLNACCQAFVYLNIFLDESFVFRALFQGLFVLRFFLSDSMVCPCIPSYTNSDRIPPRSR